jgi:diaminopimelate epimerase
MTGVPFYKMTGSGNDFVILDGRSTAPEQWPEARVRAICDRRNGVGADGLVILTPLTSDSVRMTYWNSDGSPGAMCGNAALCCGRLATELQLVPGGEFCLLTDAGAVRVRSPDAHHHAEINLPDFDPPKPFVHTALAEGESWISVVTVGVPHLVVRVNDIEMVEAATRGRFLRFHPALGSAGANVNFVTPETQSGGTWLIRTYERGVEGETLACGTGTVAAAVSLAYRREARLPLSFRSRGGLELSVHAQVSADRVSEAWLGGEGRMSFRGVWEPPNLQPYRLIP